jgi:hypothetical protein
LCLCAFAPLYLRDLCGKILSVSISVNPCLKTKTLSLRKEIINPDEIVDEIKIEEEPLW